VFSFGRSISFQ
jgi:hypothetical protein